MDHKLALMQQLKQGSRPFTEWKPTDLLLIDLETNLSHDTIWCCGWARVTPTSEVDTTIKTGYWTSPEQMLAEITPNTIVATHNGNSFDLAVLAKVWSMPVGEWHTIDTWVVENLLNPGTHMQDLSLNKLASKYLGETEQKVAFDKADFDKGLTPLMAVYCQRDCDLSLRVLLAQLALLKRRKDHPLSLLVEQECNLIINAQKRKGVLLDEKQALLCNNMWSDELNQIKDEMVRTFRPNIIVMKTKTKTIPFNPGSRPQLIERLMEKGWKPKVFTDHPTDPKPKLDEDTMDSLEDLGFPEARLAGRYFKLSKMLAFVTSWFKYASGDGRIHGHVNSNGAATGRMTHSSPNLGQIPAHDAVLGPLCRACFTVPEGKLLVGTDAKSLEERILSHYINDPEYTKKALSDGHSYRRDLLGMEGKEGRDKAKTWFYALLYGGGDAKLGYILAGKGIPKTQAVHIGGQSRLKFIDALGGLKKLMGTIQRYHEQHKAITLIDGRWITLRSAHSALNALLQGSGAVVMKIALILANNKLHKEMPGDYAFVLNVHDEFQTEVTDSKAQKASELILSSFVEAGELLKLNCPIEGDAKIGKNWSETH